MKSLLLLTMMLLFGATAGQEQHEHEQHEHEQYEQHSEHPAADGSGPLIEIGPRHYTLLPLVSRSDEGYRATLVLMLHTPHSEDGDTGAEAPGHDRAEAGAEDGNGHEAHDGAADSDEAGHSDHSGDADGVGHSDGASGSDSEHPHAEGEARLTVALLGPDGAVARLGEAAPRSDGDVTAYSVDWLAGEPIGSFDGIWRLSIAQNDVRVEVPIAVVSAVSDGTEVVAVFAPAPTLAGAGSSEAFVYAHRDLEPVHRALTLQRAMPGMQHASDDEQLPLTHDHFEMLSEIADPGGAMANRSGLDFAMTGTWQITITIEGDPPQVFSLPVVVLEE